MASRQIYVQQLTLNGNSQRERLINSTKSDVLSKIINSPSCKSVLIDGVSNNLVVINTNNNRVKTFQSMPNKSYPLGTTIDYSNYKWLITDINEDAEIYQSGVLKQCNHLFRFQNHSSDIIEYWGVLEKPQASLDEEKVVSTRGSKLKAYLPYNDDTKKIFVDKRLFIETIFDKDGKEIPVCFVVTDIVSETTNYGNGKLLELTMEATAKNENDSIVEKIANYISPITPKPAPTPDPDLLNCEISGSSILKSGGSTRDYVAKFYESDGITLNESIIAVWQFVCLPEHVSFYNTVSNVNSISIQALDNNEILGENVKLILTDTGGLYNPAEFTIKVVTAFG